MKNLTKRTMRNLTLLLAVCLIMSMVNLSAENVHGKQAPLDKIFKEGSYKYERILSYDGKKSVKIMGFAGKKQKTKVVIPAKIKHDGTIYRVTEIGNSAFEKSKIKTVILPKTVKSVGANAFEMSSKLRKVVIPKDSQLKFVGMSAFSTTPLKSIALPEKLEVIGDNAFYHCGKLTSVGIEKTNDNLLGIGEEAFAGTKIRNFHIGKKLENISSGTFKAMENLEAVDVDAGNEFFTSIDGVLYKKDLSELLIYPADGSAKTYNVPDGVSYMSEGAFADNRHLEELNLPNTLTDISKNNFNNMGALKKLEIPDSVTRIGSGFLQNCDKLEKLVIGDGVKEVFMNSVLGLPSLETVTLGKGLERIMYNTFHNLEALKEVDFKSDSMLSVDKNSFSRLPKTTIFKVTSESVKSAFDLIKIDEKQILVAEAPFEGETFTYEGVLYKVVDLPEGDRLGLLQVGNGNKPLEKGSFGAKLVLPDTISYKGETFEILQIGAGAFEGSEDLKEISLPKSVFSIKKNAFKGCVNLETVKISPLARLKYIGDSAFMGSGLKNIKLPKNLRGIGTRAFAYLDNLKSLKLPPTLIFVKDKAFEGSKYLQSLEAVSYKHKEIKGVFYNLRKGTARVTGISSSFEGKSLYIPSKVVFAGKTYTVTSMEENFADNSLYLKKLVLPSSIKSLPYFSFGKNVKIDELVLGRGMTALPEMEFEGTNGIKKIVLPNGGQIKAVKGEAFVGANALTEIVLGDSVKSIGYNEICKCPRLDSVTIKAEQLNFVGAGNFVGLSKELKVYVKNNAVKNVLLEATGLKAEQILVNSGL